METILSAPTMQCAWSETTDRALTLVRHNIESGVEFSSMFYRKPNVNLSDLQQAVATRMMRWIDALTLRCLMLDYSELDAKDTENIIYSTNSTRAKLAAPGLTLSALETILQLVKVLEESIIAVLRKRRDVAMAQKDSEITL
jgi:hypothetical protein